MEQTQRQGVKPQVSGVQELIEELRQDGIAAGQEEASRIIESARKQAAEIIKKAEADSSAIFKAKNEELESRRRAFEDALQLAVRDSVVRLKNEITEEFCLSFTGDLKKAAGEKNLIFEVVKELLIRYAESMGKQADLKLLVPKQHKKLYDGLVKNFVDKSKGKLEIEINNDQSGKADGITINFKDKDSQINISEEMALELIQAHVLPRFRSLISGHEISS